MFCYVVKIQFFIVVIKVDLILKVEQEDLFGKIRVCIVDVLVFVVSNEI